MEFVFSEYSGRLVLNPTDTILQLEHTKNGRMYEQTFFDRDFPEVNQLGGLEFVSRLLSSVFWPEKKHPGVSITLRNQTPAEVTFVLNYYPPLLVKPIELMLTLPASRRPTGSADVHELNKKLKETAGKVETLETTVKQLVPKTESLETKFCSTLEKSLESLISRIKELEERSGDFIVLPGCDYAVPTSLTYLKLVRSGTATLDNYYYSSAYPHMKCPFNQNLNVSSNPFNTNYANWQPDPNTFAIGIVQEKRGGQMAIGGRLTPIPYLNPIKNLKYIKNLSYLTIAGMPLSDTDCSIFQYLPNLTGLTISGSRKVCYPPQTPHTPTNMENTEMPGTPTITHLNWITNLKHLQTLVLVGCKNLSDISALKDLPNLKELDIRETAVKNTDFLTSSQLKITK